MKKFCELKWQVFSKEKCVSSGPSLKMAEVAFLCFSKSGLISRARVLSDGDGMQAGLLLAYRRCSCEKPLHLRGIVLYLGLLGMPAQNLVCFAAQMVSANHFYPSYSCKSI